MIVDWIITGAGAALAVLVLRDMFHMLWRPSGQGRFAAAVMYGVWWTGRRRKSTLGGPFSLATVVVLWAALLAIGFTLIYWPHMPEGFVHSSGLDVPDRSDLLDAGYFSMVTLATLGYGDVVPADGWLRVVGPIEAFSGFALWTAAVSWVMQIYPVLSRRRALALRFSLLDRTGSIASFGGDDSAASVSVLHALAADVALVRADVEQYSETAYFRDATESLSLAVQFPHGLDVARVAQQSRRTDVRSAGEVLEAGIDELARSLAGQFDGGDGDTEAAIRDFAVAHGHG